MPDYQELYLELYYSVNNALSNLVKGDSSEAIICLLEGQANTLKKIFQLDE